METILYSLSKSKKVKIWKINIEKNIEYSIIKCSYGYIEGKLTDTFTHIKEGKNIGKKNETDHYQQALNDVKSKIEKKIKEGYYYENTNIDINKDDKLQTFLPMLAQEYKKYKNKIIFPCFIQPKLDGYRMIFNTFTKKMTSRTGNEFSILYKTDLFNQLNSLNIEHIFDGELYCHKNLKFEDYGILRKKNFDEKDLKILNQIEYHIYDLIDTSLDFYKRLEILEKIKFSNKIKFVNTYVCKNQNDIEIFHKDNINKDYEGSIIRNNIGVYQCKHRSYNLLKYKDFDDDEFLIVSYSYEKDTSGNQQNLIVWICETNNKLKFNIQSKGTKEERQELYKNANKYIGCKLWIKFFGYTNEGIPRFPKTMREGIKSIRNIKE